MIKTLTISDIFAPIFADLAAVENRMREAALDMVRAAKQAGAQVAVNGSDAADHPQLYLDAGADALVVGDVEPTFLELVQHWSASGKAPLETLPGLLLRESDPCVHTLGQPDGIRRTAPRAHCVHGDAGRRGRRETLRPNLYHARHRLLRGRERLGFRDRQALCELFEQEPLAAAAWKWN